MAMQPELRSAHLHAMWTLKEAWFKRRGTGLELSRLGFLETDRSPAGPAGATLWQAEAFAMALLAPRHAAIRIVDAGACLPAAEAWRVGQCLSASEVNESA